jgi:hypothetical protein
MHDEVLMEILNCRKELSHDYSCIELIERSMLSYIVIEISLVAAFHYNVKIALIFEDLILFDNVGMV